MATKKESAPNGEYIRFSTAAKASGPAAKKAKPKHNFSSPKYKTMPVARLRIDDNIVGCHFHALKCGDIGRLSVQGLDIIPSAVPSGSSRGKPKRPPIVVNANSVNWTCFRALCGKKLAVRPAMVNTGF